MHLLALVLGCAILSAVLWDSFETLVLPRTPVRKLRLTRLFYRATWGPWIARARTLRSDRRRAGFLAVYGPISLIGLLTLWAAGLVVGFALLQWSERERPYVTGLSNRLMMSVPRFRSTSREPDNWQTEPARDGGSHL
jgi:hypothetical protein